MYDRVLNAPLISSTNTFSKLTMNTQEEKTSFLNFFIFIFEETLFQQMLSYWKSWKPSQN